MNGLRDIHEPLPPGWWPPAPGWWLVTLVVVVVLAWTVRRVWQHRGRTAPYRRARARFAGLEGRRAVGEIGPRAFADAANALLKDLLVDAEQRADAVRASGDAWLALLRERCRDAAFTGAPGRLLGDQRFRRTLRDDPAELAELVRRTLARLAPPKPERPAR